MSQVAAKVLTVSDGVVAGHRVDESGPAAAELLAQAGFDVVERYVVADGLDSVSAALRAMVEGFAGLVVTTGGTGFAPRDLTPEATLLVVDRLAPGLAEAMRASSPLGALSRAVAGIAGDAIVLNTPGSPVAVRECLEAVMAVLPHALALAAGEQGSGAGAHRSLSNAPGARHGDPGRSPAARGG